jgi:hypothetical protein
MEGENVETPSMAKDKHRNIMEKINRKFSTLDSPTGSETSMTSSKPF